MNQETITVELPKSALVAAFIEKISATAPAPAIATSRRHLPAIGERYEGGIYAGLTLHDNAPMALVLLPGNESLNWKKAGEWAEKQGGMLPSRMDALVLWQNLPKEFKEEWYWTSETYARYADCAWNQGFSNGFQDSVLKVSEDRCRAVRRVAI